MSFTVVYVLLSLLVPAGTFAFCVLSEKVGQH
jgi:hypothetical protein